MPYEKIIPESEKIAVIEPLIDLLKKKFSGQLVDYASFIFHTYVYFEIVPVYLQQYLIHSLVEVIEGEFRNRMPNYIVDHKRIVKKLNQFYSLYCEFPTIYDQQHVNRISIGQELKEVADLATLMNEIMIARQTPANQQNLETKKEIAYPIEETDKGAMIENTIDEYLESFQDTGINSRDYPFVLKTLKAFFEGQNPVIVKSYFVKRGSISKLGYELGLVYKALKSDPISFEYLNLCRQLFDCYKHIAIEENNRFNNRLYKYLTNKT